MFLAQTIIQEDRIRQRIYILFGDRFRLALSLNVAIIDKPISRPMLC
jgi:hypothetical protein